MFNPCRTDTGVFFILRYEDIIVQASILLLAPMLRQPNHTGFICLHSFVYVMCAFEYASTALMKTFREIARVAGIRESDIRKAYKGIYTYRQDLVEENRVD